MRDIAAEKNTVTAAAQKLRHEAIQDSYAGAGPPDTAFGLASILDLLAVKWTDLDEHTRGATLDGVAPLGGPPSTTARLLLNPPNNASRVSEDQGHSSSRA